MNAARIAELLQPFLGTSAPSSGHCHSEPANAGEEPGLSHSQLLSISTYIDLLLRWNARVNLTAVRDPEEIVTRHFGESLFAARHLLPGENREGHDFSRAATRAKEYGALAPEGPGANRMADLGSGAGFPGIPIKLWAPQISLTLIESSHKKATFLREVTRALSLEDVNIVAARGESLTEAKFSVVTLRAVERFAATLPVAARLVAPGGRLALLIGSAQLDQARSCLPSLSWSSPEPVPLSKARILVVATAPR